MAANFNITVDAIQNNPRLRNAPAFDQSVVKADVDLNNKQIQAALDNLAQPTIAQTAAGKVTYARAAITGASLSAVSSVLRDIFQPAISRDSLSR